MIHRERDDFFSRLAAVQPSLSPKMARVAAYVSENYVRVAFMSTSELAAAAGVSLATVVRFPVALGYRDFNQFRESIQDRVNFDLTGVERVRNAPRGNRSPAALLRHVIDADLESLHGLAQTFSEPQIERFVGALQAADRVLILGCRWVSPLAVYFWYSLAKLRDDVQVFTQVDSSLFDRVRLMRKDDVLVLLAFQRYPVDLVALARYAHTHGVRILAVTDGPLSPVVPFAETVLFVKGSVLDFFGSLAAPAALINCIASLLGVRLGEKALDRLQTLEDAAETAGIYVRGGSRHTPLTEELRAWVDDGETALARSATR